MRPYSLPVGAVALGGASSVEVAKAMRGRRLSKVKKELGTSTFENADQARRVRALRTLGLITADEVHAYGRIRAGRRAHMHLWTILGAIPIEKTASEMFDDAVFLVSSALGLGISSDGTLTMKQEVLQYVKERQP